MDPKIFKVLTHLLTLDVPLTLVPVRRSQKKRPSTSVEIFARKRRLPSEELSMGLIVSFSTPPLLTPTSVVLNYPVRPSLPRNTNGPSEPSTPMTLSRSHTPEGPTGRTEVVTPRHKRTGKEVVVVIVVVIIITP